MSLPVATSLALLALGVGIGRAWPNERPPLSTPPRLYVGVSVGAFAVGLALTNATFEDSEGVASVLGGLVAMRLAQESLAMMTPRTARPHERAKPSQPTTQPFSPAQRAPTPARTIP